MKKKISSKANLRSKAESVLKKKSNLHKKIEKLFKIASAQINSTLGDFSGNADKIIDCIQRAKSKNADLVVFPESALFGYHPFDLLERSEIVRDQLSALAYVIKNMPEGISALVGHISVNKAKKGRPYFNSSSLISKGKIHKTFNKELLPTGDVFDEARFIENGLIEKNIFELKGYKFLVTICEDMWAWPDSKGRSNYAKNPLLGIKNKKFDLIINQSASPFYFDKISIRKKLAKLSARHFKSPFLYTNLVGAQDEIIFDGGSFVIDHSGKLLMQSLQFQEDLNYFVLHSTEGGIRPLIHDSVEILRQALVLGIRDFCSKVGIKSVHLGLSGGIDSAVIACLAVDAMGPKNVKLLYMPSRYSSELSGQLAFALAENLQSQLIEVPISKAYEGFKESVDTAFNIKEFGLTHENLQARIRGTFLMAFSNSQSSLLLNTSNKSEFAAGYSTLYGDMCGGLCPIGDLTKKQVYSLAELYNSEAEIIPRGIISRAPSAELRPNQKDSDSLPEYDLLDESVVHLVERSGAIRNETDRWLLNAIYKSEFKRWQAPPILKVSQHSFGRGRRYPISHRARS